MERNATARGPSRGDDRRGAGRGRLRRHSQGRPTGRGRIRRPTRTVLETPTAVPAPTPAATPTPVSTGLTIAGRPSSPRPAPARLPQIWGAASPPRWLRGRVVLAGSENQGSPSSGIRRTGTHWQAIDNAPRLRRRCHRQSSFGYPTGCSPWVRLRGSTRSAPAAPSGATRSRRSGSGARPDGLTWHLLPGTATAPFGRAQAGAGRGRTLPAWSRSVSWSQPRAQTHVHDLDL